MPSSAQLVGRRQDGQTADPLCRTNPKLVSSGMAAVVYSVFSAKNVALKQHILTKLLFMHNTFCTITNRKRSSYGYVIPETRQVTCKHINGHWRISLPILSTCGRWSRQNANRFLSSRNILQKATTLSCLRERVNTSPE